MMSSLGMGWVRWLLLGALLVGCGGDTDEDPTADDAPTGGRTTGGSPNGGSEGNEGGSTGTTTGGTANAGAPGTGGAQQGGGVPSGGANEGGDATTGGLSSGGTATGGASGSGGAPSGGAPGSGGEAAGPSVGGASGNGGTAGAGDGDGGTAAGAGVTGALGGTSGGGGAPGTGGSAGAPASEVECDDPADCLLSIADCVCRALPVDDPRALEPRFCEADPCLELDVTEANVTCLRGRCSLALACDGQEVDCAMAEPNCPEGQTAFVTGGCWGPCVPVEECMPAPYGPGPAVFEGVWLIGWEDEARHFSALRLPSGVDAAVAGVAELLADPGIPNNQPLFPCSGPGEFMMTAVWGGFSIDQPADCDPGANDLYLVFQDLGDAGGRWGSTLHATIETVIEGEVRDLDAYWFSADTCDAAMATCTFGDT